jgi:hypothetical protein
MKPERWQEIMEQVRKSFTIEDEGKYEDEEQGGTTVEYIEFSGPLGHLRLEFSTHRAILETKTKYHKRIGSETEVEYVYSPFDKVHTLQVFKWDDAQDEWVPFETKAFNE